MRTASWNFGPAPIGRYFFALTIAVALPILLFVLFLTNRLQMDNYEALKRRTVREAQTLAISVERQLQDITTTLKLLSTAPELEVGDLESFHKRSQLALAGSPLFVLLLNGEGQQLVNTRVSFGTPLGLTSNLDAFKRALSDGKTTASDVFFGATSQKWVFNVLMPLPSRLMAGAAVLLVTQNAEEVSRLIVPDGLPEGWTAALLDGSGRIIAGSDVPTIRSGDAFAYWNVVPTSSSSGQFEHQDDIVGYARLQGWSWTAVAWGPKSSARASILRNWSLLLLAAILLLTLAITAAALMGSIVQRSISSLATQARRLGAGEIVPPIETNIQEVNAVSLALTDASFDQSQAEARIHVVVGELSHRTKNLLTVVGAMVQQTARAHEVAPEYVFALTSRLQGLSSSIDLLAQDNWSGVSLKTLLRGQLEKFAYDLSQLTIVGEDFTVRSEAVQPLGLALHELATNAMKYGALSTPDGRVAIEWFIDWSEDVPSIEISWRESGGPVVSPPSRKGFGSTITGRHIADSFDGRSHAQFDSDGFTWSLVAPLEALQNASEPGPGRSADK